MSRGAAPLPPGDPRAILGDRPMGTLQVVGVGLCFLLNAFDGFDVLAITFAAPGIAREWAIDPGAIGLVISLGLASSALALTAMFSLHMAAFYYVLGWVPSLVTALGFSQSDGAIVSMFLNLGGVAGGVAFGFLVGFVGLRPVLLTGFFAAAAAVALFGQTWPELGWLKAAAFAIGFAANGSIIAFYALLARAYPVALRAAGAGLTVGIGRLGAACGPILAGYLIAADVSRGAVSLILALGSVAAGLIFLAVPIRGAREDRPLAARERMT